MCGFRGLGALIAAIWLCGCNLHLQPDCVLETPNAESAAKVWFGADAKPSISHQSQHWGVLPNGGPVTLAILPLDTASVQESPDCRECPSVRGFLSTFTRPLWLHDAASRVRVVDRPDEADWVLEGRLAQLYVGNALQLYLLASDPIPMREYWVETWFRIRERRSGRVLWTCRINAERESRVVWRKLQAQPLHEHLQRHLNLLTMHLNASLNGLPGLS